MEMFSYVYLQCSAFYGLKDYTQYCCCVVLLLLLLSLLCCYYFVIVVILLLLFVLWSGVAVRPRSGCYSTGPPEMGLRPENSTWRVMKKEPL